MRKFLQFVVGALLIIHFVVTGFSIDKWLMATADLYFITYPIPKEYRIFYSFPAECNFIRYINENIPEDASLLSIPKVSILTNYHVYPRKLYHFKDFAAGETIIIDRESLRKRKIEYVYFDNTAIYHLKDVIERDERDPAKIIIKRPYV
jgi:hypothetical protein